MPLALMRICALRCARGKQQRLAAVALRQPVVARTFASPASPIPAPVTDVASTSVSGDATRGARSWMEPVNLHPRAVVEALSRHIIGQDDAKRAIAIALRNRWRRTRLPQEMQDEIIPKNILMVGPTGCGKTEIARRLAKLCRAPFVKVEATKFTEVGYHGRDVDTIIKDLMDASLTLVKELKTEALAGEIAPAVEERLIEALTGPGAAEDTVESFRGLLRSGSLDDREVVVELPAKDPRSGGGGASGGVAGDIDLSIGSMGGAAAIDLGEFMHRILPGATNRGKSPLQKRTMKVREARAALHEAEVDRRLSQIDLRREAVQLAEQNGIVFIDEIDKIISNKSKHSGDASAEGVQRDLLPLIEGTTVEVRRFGNVRTDYMLFVASGAFHDHKPSDMLAELQGRLPIRVELKGLDAGDLHRILTEPRFNLLEQQRALLASEGVALVFDADAVAEIARLAAEVNRTVENIGARRLHTVIERIMEDVSFVAPELVPTAAAAVADAAGEVHAPTPGSAAAPTAAVSVESPVPVPADGAAAAVTPSLEGKSARTASQPSEAPPVEVRIDLELVRKKLLPMLERSDLSRFIL